TPTERSQYHYDDLGRQDWALQQSWVSGAWQDQVRADSLFDTENRVTRVTTQQAGLLSSWIGYGYDPVTGRRTTTQTAARTLAYCYDTLGRLTEVRPNGNPDCTSAQPGATVYAYTPVSTLQSVVRPTGVTTSYGYDARHRVLTVTHQPTAGG